MESAFCDPLPEGLILIETLRYDPGIGLLRDERHLARMARGAASLGIAFDGIAASQMLKDIEGPEPTRVRLTLDCSGAFRLEWTAYKPSEAPWRVTLASERVTSKDPWLTVKTSQRLLYDRVRRDLPETVEEALLLNERGELAEGTITNVFLKRDDIFLTPPLTCGCLPGILREELLETGRAEEAILTPEELTTGELYVGNSLRGLIPCLLI